MKLLINILFMYVAINPIGVLAQGIINIDLSYKIVLNPANGNRPFGVTDGDIDDGVEEMNDLLQSYYRGYRVRRVDPIIEIGGLNDDTGPSRWFNTDFFDNETGQADKEEMEEVAVNGEEYAWNENAINIYITNGISGGVCSFPDEFENIIVVGAGSHDTGWLLLHEIGHYFSLCHTQGCTCGCCVDSAGICNTIPGDDGIGDTLPDLACFNQDGLSNNSFGTNYINLSATNRTRVDNVFFNIMSYHSSACGQGANVMQLTEQQLDRWTDISNTTRSNAVNSRKSLFVDTNSQTVSSNGSSARPFMNLMSAVDSANQNDILLIKSGNYNTPDSYTINQALSIRTPRGSIVHIGTEVTPPTEAAIAQLQQSLQLGPEMGQPVRIQEDKPPVRLGFPGSNNN